MEERGTPVKKKARMYPPRAFWPLLCFLILGCYHHGCWDWGLDSWLAASTL